MVPRPAYPRPLSRPLDVRALKANRGLLFDKGRIIGEESPAQLLLRMGDLRPSSYSRQQVGLGATADQTAMVED